MDGLDTVSDITCSIVPVNEDISGRTLLLPNKGNTIISNLTSKVTVLFTIYIIIEIKV